MKKIIFLIAAVLLLLCSCTSSGTDSTPPVTDEEEKLIYDQGISVVVVRNDVENVTGDMMNGIINRLQTATGKIPTFRDDTSAQAEHEVVIGPTSRPISKAAYAALDGISDDDTAAYVIYSDGTSVAVAYTVGEVNMASIAVEYLVNTVFAEDSLCLDVGLVHSDTVSVRECINQRDEELIAAKWAEVESKLAENGGAELAARIVESLKELYAIYTDDLIVWLANLYDPSTGGFYYSNSARDTYGYFPDIESTYQALMFITNTGMAEQYGGLFENAIPESLKAKVAEFILGLQDPDGYFYHPQWGKNITSSRQGRDLNSATSLLKKLGYTPKYKLPTDASASSSASLLTPQIRNTGATFAVSSVLGVADLSNAPERFKSEENYRTYLAGLDLRNNSYSIGNELQASVSQINAYGQLLGVDLMDITMDWLDENQDPETGLWHYEIGYTATNSLHKIFSVYNSAKRPIPNVEKSVESAIASITSEEPLSAGVDIYNAWSVLPYVYTNIRKYNTASGTDFVNETIARIREAAPEMIEVTMRKIAVFKKEDGSFSYGPKYSANTSQGAPTAVKFSIEGDVNGTCIACTSLVTHIFRALDLNNIVPIYTYGDLLTYLDVIENAQPVVKNDPPENEPVTFENDTVGGVPTGITVKDNSSSGSSVVNDPKGDGKVYRLVSVAGKADIINLPNNTSQTEGNCYIFESEFLVESYSGTYQVQISLGNAYMFTLRIKDGKVKIYDSSTNKSATSLDNNFGASVAVGEWFKVRVEHYVGDETTVRTVFYLDGTPIAVSDNYKGKPREGTGTPDPTFKHVAIYVLSSVDLVMYLDDLYADVETKTYSPIRLENSDWLNVDKDLLAE